MNIHFTDKKLFKKLKESTITKVIVGSHMYGTNNESSDIDYLYIYTTSSNELNSFVKTHHQLQYKEDDIDHNFVSLHTFLQNTLNGDSTINFEVINSDSLIGTELEWLSKYKKSFLTYTVIRSYLGLARRDIKRFHTCKNDYEKTKRLKHIIRGYIYARDMIINEFDFNKCNRELLSIIIDTSNNKQLRVYEGLISSLRNDLTDKFNNNTLGLSQHINVSEGIEVNNKLLDFCKSDFFIEKQKHIEDFDMSPFINAFENWVEY